MKLANRGEVNEMEKRAIAKEDKRKLKMKVKMKVSGAGVKEILRIKQNKK